jgi:hypothetical protein
VSPDGHLQGFAYPLVRVSHRFEVRNFATVVPSSHATVLGSPCIHPRCKLYPHRGFFDVGFCNVGLGDAGRRSGDQKHRLGHAIAATLALREATKRQAFDVQRAESPWWSALADSLNPPRAFPLFSPPAQDLLYRAQWAAGSSATGRHSGVDIADGACIARMLVAASRWRDTVPGW